MYVYLQLHMSYTMSLCAVFVLCCMFADLELSLVLSVQNSEDEFFFLSEICVYNIGLDFGESYMGRKGSGMIMTCMYSCLFVGIGVT